jgi:hypothetical protein
MLKKNKARKLFVVFVYHNGDKMVHNNCFQVKTFNDFAYFGLIN